ncbi:MAG: DUF3473 domain-containing protein [Smithella sp.]|nr:DUF3473 domain-containing protein [Smithella sp.]
MAGKMFSVFGGGYLRIAPIFLIQWGVSKPQKIGLPTVIYVHPHEVDLSLSQTSA